MRGSMIRYEGIIVVTRLGFVCNSCYAVEMRDKYVQIYILLTVSHLCYGSTCRMGNRPSESGQQVFQELGSRCVVLLMDRTGFRRRNGSR